MQRGAFDCQASIFNVRNDWFNVVLQICNPKLITSTLTLTQNIQVLRKMRWRNFVSLHFLVYCKEMEMFEEIFISTLCDIIFKHFLDNSVIQLSAKRRNIANLNIIRRIYVKLYRYIFHAQRVISSRLCSFREDCYYPESTQRRKIFAEKGNNKILHGILGRCSLNFIYLFIQSERFVHH